MIDAKYLDLSNSTDAWRLESYRAVGNVSSGVAQQLRCYFVSKCHFPTRETTQVFTDEESPEDVKVDIRTVSDSAFLEKATDNTLEIYQEVMDEALNRFVFLFPFDCSTADVRLDCRMGPVVTAYEIEGSRERRIVIGYKQGGTASFFSALSDLYHSCLSLILHC